MKETVEPMFRQFIINNQVENLVALYSTGNYKYLGGCLLKTGTKYGIRGIDYDAIFSMATDLKARRIWVAHNHTAPDLTPSKADIEFTMCFADECHDEDFKFMDHYILHPTQGYARIAMGLASMGIW